MKLYYVRDSLHIYIRRSLLRVEFHFAFLRLIYRLLDNFSNWGQLVMHTKQTE